MNGTTGAAFGMPPVSQTLESVLGFDTDDFLSK